MKLLAAMFAEDAAIRDDRSDIHKGGAWEWCSRPTT